ncbi:MAG: methyltransferase domain-containing protein [Theionarchaea archaeon]|nr:methyltransferase domain-containing protein [Theionarchaea archaeon]
MDVERYYDEKAPFYDGEYKTPFFQLYKEITWDDIKRFLPESGVILDAGGGTGEWAIQLAELGYSIVLTDISRGMLRQARLKLEERNIHTVELKRADITNMSCLPDETFDMALVQGDPLSYCGDAEKAAKEVHRVLKPGCFCIASVDSMYSAVATFIASNRVDELEDFLRTQSASFRAGFTIHYFTPESLRKLFEDAGFEVVRIRGKPVFLSVIPREIAHNLLQDKKTFEKILELELRYCDDTSLVGFARHLEIVGKKREKSQCPGI